MDPWRQRLGGRGQGAGRQELGGRRQERSACLTTGLPGYGQGCSPRLWCCNTRSWPPKKTVLGEVFARVLIFGPRGFFLEGFGRFLEVSRMFCTGVSPLHGQVGGEL